jgi:hypothetical protein
MTPKEELNRNIEVLENSMNNIMLQCKPNIAMISRHTTKNNYESFIRKEISKEELEDNNNRIWAATRKFMDLCSCMREFKR